MKTIVTVIEFYPQDMYNSKDIQITSDNGIIFPFTISRSDIFLVISSVESLSHVQLFVTPWTAIRQASPSITNSWSLLKLMCIKLVMPSNHLILCCPLLLPSIFPNIWVFSNESVLRCSKY